MLHANKKQSILASTDKITREFTVGHEVVEITYQLQLEKGIGVVGFMPAGKYRIHIGSSMVSSSSGPILRVDY